ncbi:UNVERIFIED_CONTAM: hypothetical protein GTU68_060135 [Idotea baltica]|nr:hypothetical protein [Idotea baltica]
MAGSLNKVMLIGNLGADPEVRTFQNGGKVCNLRIATSENWRDKNTANVVKKPNGQHGCPVQPRVGACLLTQYLRKAAKFLSKVNAKTRKWQDINQGMMIGIHRSWWLARV